MAYGARKRNYRKEYDDYHSKPGQRKRNDQRKKTRRLMEKNGRVRKFDGKDVDHKDNDTSNLTQGNLRVMSKSRNRSKK